MFYEEYKKKSDGKLIEILNSDAYQLAARETAQKILNERSVDYQIKDEQSELIKLNSFQLFERLEQYGLRIDSSRRKRWIEVRQNNYGMEICFVSFLLCFIFLTLTFMVVFSSPTPGDITYSGSKAAGMKGGWSATITFFIIAIMNYDRDKKSIVKISFKKNMIAIRQRRKWKREQFDFNFRATNIEFRKKKNRYFIFVRLKNREVVLFDFKDNNIGNKTEVFLSVWIDKLNEEMILVGN